MLGTSYKFHLKNMMAAVKESYRSYKRRLEEEKSKLGIIKKRKNEQCKETKQITKSFR